MEHKLVQIKTLKIFFYLSMFPTIAYRGKETRLVRYIDLYKKLPSRMIGNVGI